MSILSFNKSLELLISDCDWVGKRTQPSETFRNQYKFSIVRAMLTIIIKQKCDSMVNMNSYVEAELVNFHIPSLSFSEC